MCTFWNIHINITQLKIMSKILVPNRYKYIYVEALIPMKIYGITRLESSENCEIASNCSFYCMYMDIAGGKI